MDKSNGIKGGKGGTIYPPKKGEVRNPKGYPKGLENTKTRLKRLLLLTAKEVDERIGKELTEAEAMDLSMLREAKTGNVAAYRELLDRMEGKVAQSMDIEHSGNVNNNGVIQIEYVPVAKELEEDESK